MVRGLIISLLEDLLKELTLWKKRLEKGIT